MNTNQFNPERLTLARQKRKLTKTALANLAGVVTRSISAYECGATIPTAETIMALSQALKFPAEFFFAPPIDHPEVDAVSFRSLSSMTAGQRDSALAASQLAIALTSWIENRFILPECKLNDLRDYTPENAAASIRTCWGLGQKPIKNAIHLLESNGVRVFSLAEDCKQVDAYSFWLNSTPFIFLNTFKSGEHSRFDAMHELGHLVMHRHGGPDGRAAEHEADAFASAMLMPKEDILAQAPRLATIPSLIQLKKRWTVSLSALNYRLHALRITTDWHYRTLCIQISENGFRSREPEPCKRETSQMLQKVLAALKSDGISRSDIANALCIRNDDLDAIMFGLVMTSISGGKKDNAASDAPKRQHLRIVSNGD